MFTVAVALSFSVTVMVGLVSSLPVTVRVTKYEGNPNF